MDPAAKESRRWVRIVLPVMLVLTLLGGLVLWGEREWRAERTRDYTTASRTTLDRDLPRALEHLDAERAAGDRVLHEAFGVARTERHTTLVCAVMPPSGFSDHIQTCRLIGIDVYPSVPDDAMRTLPGEDGSPLGRSQNYEETCGHLRSGVFAEGDGLKAVGSGSPRECFSQEVDQSFDRDPLGVRHRDLDGSAAELPERGLYVFRSAYLPMPSVPCRSKFSILTCAPLVDAPVVP